MLEAGTPLELPDRAACDYLARFGVGAVYIIAAGAGCIIGSGTDLGDELAAARKVCKDLDPPQLVWAAWCFDLRAAQQVRNLSIACDLRRAQRDGPRLLVSVTEAVAAIKAAAGRLHFRLTDHAAVLARAKATSTTLEDRLVQVQDAGLLRDFNKEYQRRRMAAKLAGRKLIDYQTARRRLRAVLAAVAAGRYSGDVIRRVFEAE
jgi:hypothetical protein